MFCLLHSCTRLSLLVWPQWWSFADVSQQGVDFSKKNSKMKTIFWFDHSLHDRAEICQIFFVTFFGKIWYTIHYLLVSWESEATPSATPFFKRAYKISHPPRLWVSWIDLPSFASSSKIWPNFINKVFFSWSYEKVILTKKCAPNLLFFNEKKFTLKVQFSHFAPSWQS